MESASRTITMVNNRVQLDLEFKENTFGENQKVKEDEKEKRTKQEPKRKRVTWSEDTIDNEHMGKKKSNICCIYCPRRHTAKYDEQYIETCSSDDNNELERSNQSKREHLKHCSKHIGHNH